ncbi:MAG TPA: GNAT family N-acetyltransferase [Roseiflexaceae bacterium]|nr:GNAT family N-acetyltransferase [Roseiflexaceae bacterium]
MSDTTVVIREFVAGDEQGVVELIVPIQREEFGVQITAEDQPDLQSIPEFYQRGAGNFWVALDGGRVVGTIALLDIGGGQGALRKMFVHPRYRGRASGVAQRLLETLLGWARGHGLAAIFLGTTPQYLAAHRFYEKNGFARIDSALLPETFPIMKVDTIFFWRALGS